MTARLLTAEQYLAHCTDYPNEKFELFNGQLIAMGTASSNHDVLKAECTRKIGRFFDDNEIDCLAIPETKLTIGNHFFIPDVMIVCKKREQPSFDFNQPIVIIEILSDSTRGNDFTIKLNEYQKIANLQEYLVIEQDLVQAYHYSQRSHWKATVMTLGDTLTFESIGFSMPLSDLYKYVEFRSPQIPH